MPSRFAQLAAILLLLGLAGCAEPGDFRRRMEQAATPKSGIQQTRFAHIGEVQTAKGKYHVAVQRRILSGMLAPRGLPLRLLVFDDEARLVAAYEPDFPSMGGVEPLWCEESRVYLFGFGSFYFADSFNRIDTDPRLRRLFP